MVKIHIDEKPVEVIEGTTIFKAAEQAGVPIPHFCFHPAFVPEGSCRLCLVEIDGFPKLELSCSTVARAGMKVSTQSPLVREARRSVLEFLLAEHPLDCPICDKAGECKLQDYYQDYGLTESVFREFKEKRDKKVKIGGKLILDRERCILCRRCVRFLSEITKTDELGVFERGIHTEISTYDEELVDNNYSGNLVDLCPVGAITDVEFRFKTRTWFLVRGESICPLCSRGCNIYIDYHPGFPRVPGTAKVYRIRPRTNESVNGHWICDFGRYGFVSRQQMNRCDKLIWNKADKKTELSWEKVLILLGERIQSLRESQRTDKIALVLTSWLTNEELYLAKKIFKDDLNAGKIFFADPRAGEGDGFLLRGERSPNSRGAQEIGFELKPARIEALSQGPEILIIFGGYLAEAFGLSELRKAFENIPAKVLVTSHLNGLESLVDFVLPSAFTSEKSGSWTNADSRIQRFTAVAPACGDIRPEARILTDLARELKLDDAFYGRLKDTAAIFKELVNDIPFFRTGT